MLRPKEKYKQIEEIATQMANKKKEVENYKFANNNILSDDLKHKYEDLIEKMTRI